ncbi:MAG: hypothetical protein VB101_10000 [Rhodospirillaceae bacterium]|nr:hypothetical protein [Rhodospirillaceae bacterium]
MLIRSAEINVQTGDIEYTEREVDEIAIAPSIRIAEIDARLTAIDLASVRALRATVAGAATEADRDQLAVWEAEAAALRSERAGLTAVSPNA